MKKLSRKIVRAISNPGIVAKYLMDKYQLDRKLNLLSSPGEFSLNLSWYCNFKCKMCDIGLKNSDSNLGGHYLNQDKHHLSLQEWKSFIDTLAAISPNPSIQLAGTEPTLYPDFLELVTYIKSKGMYVSITTNAWLLDKYLESLMQLNVDEIGLSIDGLEKTHDFIRGMDGAFNRVMRCISLFTDLKKSYPRSKTILYSNTTITEYNYKELIDLYNVLISKDALTSIFFSHLWFKTKRNCEIHNRLYLELKAVPTNLGIDIAKVPADEILQTVNFLKRQKNTSFFPRLSDKELTMYYTDPEARIGNKGCLSPWRQLSVMPNGDIVLGGQCFDTGVLGNIQDGNVLDIWRNSAILQKVRTVLSKHNGYLPGCSRCCVLFKYQY